MDGQIIPVNMPAGIRMGRLQQKPSDAELRRLPTNCGLAAVVNGIIECTFVRGCFAHNREGASRYFGSPYCVPGDNGRNCHGERD